MGYEKQSELRRAENEVVFKQQNERVQRQAEYLLPNENKASFPVSFVCECSDEDCQEHIELSVHAFESVHKDDRHFIIKPHHEQPDIERVVEATDHYSIVEKNEEPPSTDGKLNRTSANSPASD